ncbi:unnamed protein product [Miscanthus lutarioriparius]|uniref:Uncharacterized protein n=1 Tax=Miscanthus lutarioriparius TaxID=422564 RepID=A0A811PHR8_9POAL|nr:unnamed protein product [Miscanthus lutarioriparius]
MGSGDDLKECGCGRYRRPRNPAGHSRLLPPSPSSRSSSPTSCLPPPLPPLLRGHLAASHVLKLDPAPGLFAVTSRPIDSSGGSGGGSPAHRIRVRVLVLPGLAAGSLSFRRVLSSLSSRGVHATALDLPSQGLSPAHPRRARARALPDQRAPGDHGPRHRPHLRAPRADRRGPVPGGGAAPRSPHAPDEAAAAVTCAAEALGLGVAPVHLVLHDTALAAGAAFASAHRGPCGA